MLNELKKALKSVFSRHEEILAAWIDKEMSDKYNVVFVNIVYDKEKTKHTSSLRHDLIMEMIPVEAKFDLLVDFSLDPPQLAPLTEEIADDDYIIRIDHYSSPQDAIPLRCADDTVNKPKMERLASLARILAEQPELMDDVRQYAHQRYVQNADNMRAYALEEWDEILSKMPHHLILLLISGNSPRIQRLCCSSPFCVLSGRVDISEIENSKDMAS